MGYRDRIRVRAESRGVLSLAHFTQFQNLEGIVEHGLLSRVGLAERGLDALESDPWRLDGDNGATSLSVSDINWDMFRTKRKDYPRAVWVVLFFQPSILWTHECRFCFRNAAHKDLNGCRKFRGGPWGFDTMFEDKAPTFMFKGHSYRRQTGIAPHYPTRPDAEVQVRKRIAPELIMGASLYRRDLADHVRALLKRLPGDGRTVLEQDF